MGAMIIELDLTVLLDEPAFFVFFVLDAPRLHTSPDLDAPRLRTVTHTPSPSCTQTSHNTTTDRNTSVDPQHPIDTAPAVTNALSTLPIPILVVKVGRGAAYLRA
jgi:hypothetical protein